MTSRLGWGGPLTRVPVLLCAEGVAQNGPEVGASIGRGTTVAEPPRMTCCVGRRLREAALSSRRPTAEEITSSQLFTRHPPRLATPATRQVPAHGPCLPAERVTRQRGVCERLIVALRSTAG